MAPWELAGDLRSGSGSAGIGGAEDHADQLPPTEYTGVDLLVLPGCGSATAAA
jgi:hypothetical protein